MPPIGTARITISTARSSSYINYAIGYVSGLLDRAGLFRLSGLVYRLPGGSASRIDGFDAGVELLRR